MRATANGSEYLGLDLRRCVVAVIDVVRGAWIAHARRSGDMRRRFLCGKHASFDRGAAQIIASEGKTVNGVATIVEQCPQPVVMRCVCAQSWIEEMDDELAPVRTFNRNVPPQRRLGEIKQRVGG